MAITFKELKNIVAEYSGKAGKCSDSKEATRFAKEVMEHLLFSGQYGSIRKFCFIAQKGCITLPPEIEVPLKVRIDGHISTVWNRWYEWYSVSEEFEGAIPCDKVLVDEPNLVATAFEFPKGGSKIGAIATCEEEEGASVIIQGKDALGNTIFTTHNGEEIFGEKITLQKDVLKYGKVHFNEITAVIKSKTRGYAELYAVCPETKSSTFLSTYSPLEEKPQYKRARVNSKSCGDLTHITMLARIRLKESYADNELIPFESTIPIKIAAQRLQAEANGDIQTAGYKRQVLDEFIERESAYKKTSGSSPIEVFFPLSAGAIKNLY